MFELLQMGPVQGPLGSLLMAVLALAVIVLIGRVVLNVAWRVLKLTGVVIGALWLASVAVPNAPF